MSVHSQVIGENSQLLADPSEANTLANSITNHVMAHLSMLRHLKVESACPVSSGRRFPKSGGFRRNMDASEWPMVNGLLSKMEVDNSVSMPAPIEIPPPGVELDELGFPTIFRQILDSVSDDDVEKETVLYDDNGFPTCFDVAMVGETAPDEELQPVTPRAHKRKAYVIKGRKGATGGAARKGRAAASKKGGGRSSGGCGGGCSPKGSAGSPCSDGGPGLGCSKCRWATRGCARCIRLARGTD